MNHLSPVVLSENPPPSSFAGAPGPGPMPGGSRHRLLSHPADTATRSLPVLTIRQLIGWLADTEDQSRRLRHPMAPEVRNLQTMRRRVLREQRLVMDELHRRHALSSDESSMPHVPGTTQNLAHS